MDFTADYGLKTRQVASWFWLRRGVLHIIKEISQRLETKEKYKYLGSPVWPAELGGGAGWWNCLPTAAASSTTVTHSSVRLVDNFFDFKYFSSRILSSSYQLLEYQDIRSVSKKCCICASSLSLAPCRRLLQDREVDQWSAASSTTLSRHTKPGFHGANIKKSAQPPRICHRPAGTIKHWFHRYQLEIFQALESHLVECPLRRVNYFTTHFFWVAEKSRGAQFAMFSYVRNRDFSKFLYRKHHSW